MSLSQRCAGPALLALCGTCLILQVLVRPAVGIANNGDFVKMAGPLNLGPEDGTWQSHQQYGEFIYRFIRADRFAWNRPFRSAEFISSEYFFVKLARGLQRIFQPGPRFDIRWLGGVSGVLFLVAIGIWIYALPARWRWYAGLPVIFIWTDVAYVQYLNSFYMDAAAMIFLLLSVGAGLQAIKDRNRRLFPILMVAGVLLFATSKPLHAVAALFFIPLFLGLAFRSRDRVARGAWIAGSVLLVIGASSMLARDTPQQRSTPVYTMVFWRLAPQAPDPLRALEELGLGKSELRYLHTHAYSPSSPMQDLEWVRQFHARCNFAILLRYYLHHSSVAAHFLYQDLSGPASRIRPFGNLSVDDGYIPSAKATTFGYWTNLRADLLKHAPWHIIPLAAAMFVSAFWLLLRSPADRPLAGLALVIQTLAALEYGVAVLADAAETDRHLFMFHVATEISILLFIPLVLRIYARHRIRGSGEPRETIAVAGQAV